DFLLEEDELQPQYDDDNDGESDDDSGSETLDVEYWDSLFQHNIDSGTNTEWLMSYSSLAPHLAKFLRPGGRVLVVGCGDSDLSHGLYSDGFHDLTSCDISPVVVQHMKVQLYRFNPLTGRITALFAEWTPPILALGEGVSGPRCAGSSIPSGVKPLRL
ncbi:hypothetical protein CYMTET_34147, partial [Cymbomonas tetramitiformis]